MGADPDVIIQTYFKRYMTEEQNYKDEDIKRYPPSIMGGQVQPVQNLAKQQAASGQGTDERVERVMNQLRDFGMLIN